MCLLAKSKQVKKSKKRKRCFKVLCLLDDGIIVSPFIREKYELDSLKIDKNANYIQKKGDKLFETRGEHLRNRRLYEYEYEIKYGLHTFKTIEDALDDLEGDEIVVECFIPAGVEYIEGIVHYGYETKDFRLIEGYVSGKLEVGKKTYTKRDRYINFAKECNQSD